MSGAEAPSAAPAQDQPPGRGSINELEAAARWKVNQEARAILEKVFLQEPLPSKETISRLAFELQVTARRVQVWFQNRRQRCARKWVNKRTLSVRPARGLSPLLPHPVAVMDGCDASNASGALGASGELAAGAGGSEMLSPASPGTSAIGLAGLQTGAGQALPGGVNTPCQMLLENAPPHRIMWASLGWLELSGYLLSQVLGYTLALFQGSATDARLVSTLLQSVAEQGKEASSTVVHYTKAGRPFHHIMKLEPLRDTSRGDSHLILATCAPLYVPAQDFRPSPLTPAELMRTSVFNPLSAIPLPTDNKLAMGQLPDVPPSQSLPMPALAASAVTTGACTPCLAVSTAEAAVKADPNLTLPPLLASSTCARPDSLFSPFSMQGPIGAAPPQMGIAGSATSAAAAVQAAVAEKQRNHLLKALQESQIAHLQQMQQQQQMQYAQWQQLQMQQQQQQIHQLQVHNARQQRAGALGGRVGCVQADGIFAGATPEHAGHLMPPAEDTADGSGDACGSRPGDSGLADSLQDTGLVKAEPPAESDPGSAGRREDAQQLHPGRGGRETQMRARLESGTSGRPDDVSNAFQELDEASVWSWLNNDDLSIEVELGDLQGGSDDSGRSRSPPTTSVANQMPAKANPTTSRGATHSPKL